MFRSFMFLCCVLFVLPALAAVEMPGGWSISAEGGASSTGTSELSYVSSDPTITLAILSASSLYGPGSVSLLREGGIEKSISSGDFDISAGFDGRAESEVILESSGTAYAAAFVGATAAAIPTGDGSHEIFGVADVFTECNLVGKGSVEASASGKSSYRASVRSATSEVWGEVQGSSITSLTGSSADSLASTSGNKNGIHTESRVLSNRRGEISGSSISMLSAYGSAINSATAKADVTGTAMSGGWDPTSSSRSRLSNENVASSAAGTLKGDARAPGSGDAASVIAMVESTAKRNTALYTGMPLGIYASGGPSSYASSTQSSSSTETYAQALIENPLWGSVAREPGRTALEWGRIETTGSGAISREQGAYALSFAKIQLTTDLLERSGTISSSGNITLATSTEISGSKKAVAGAIAHGNGYGDMWTDDGFMKNFASYTGDAEMLVHHYSYVSSEEIRGEISNIAKNIIMEQNPGGRASLAKPFAINTTSDPMYAWSSTEGWYYQEH